MAQRHKTVRLKAYSEFPIEFLLRCSDRLREGFYVLNKSMILLAKKDIKLLYVLMADEYGWDYSNIYDSTIYFLETDNGVYKGIYNLSTQECVTQKDFF